MRALALALLLVAFTVPACTVPDPTDVTDGWDMEIGPDEILTWDPNGGKWEPGPDKPWDPNDPMIEAVWAGGKIECKIELIPLMVCR